MDLVDQSFIRGFLSGGEVCEMAGPGKVAGSARGVASLV
jgi:hypothetical protein